MIKMCFILAVMLLSLPLSAQAATETRQYRGEMELVTLSGTSCGKGKPGDKIAVDLTVKITGDVIDGYYSGQRILAGHFSGTTLHNLTVAYLGDAPSAKSENRMSLSPVGDNLVGEIREKPLAAGKEGCNFDLARFSLQPVAQGAHADIAFARQEKISQAEYENRLAISSYDSGRLVEAIQHFEAEIALREAVESNNSLTLLDPLLVLSVAYAATDRFDKGKGLQDRALALPMEALKRKIWRTVVLPKLFADQAERLAEDGRSDKAITLFEKAIAAYPDLTSLYVRMAQVMVQQNQPTEACDRVARALTKSRDDIQIKSAQAVCLAWQAGQEKQSQDVDAAIAIYEQALKLNPEDLTILGQLGATLIARGTPDAALVLFKDSAAVIVKNIGQKEYEQSLAMLYAAIGENAAKKQDYVAAELQYRKALEFDPLKSAYTIALAGVLQKSGRFSQSLSLLEELLRKCPDNVCREQTGNAIERERQLEKIIRKLDS